jgi:hypothetical protein
MDASTEFGMPRTLQTLAGRTCGWHALAWHLTAVAVCATGIATNCDNVNMVLRSLTAQYNRYREGCMPVIKNAGIQIAMSVL